MKIKTSELTGAALDWAVAKCEKHEIDSLMGGAVWYWLKCSLTGELEVVELFRPSADWAQGGPIIEREHIDLSWQSAGQAGWMAYGDDQTDAGIPIYEGNGPTPLIAAMRCYVASNLDDEVEVPDELA